MIMQTAIGIVGLGQMGKPMARNLARAGFKLHFVSSKEHKDLEEDGAQAVETVSQLAAQCEVIMLVVPGECEIERVLWGADGIFHKPTQTLVIVCSSVDPRAVKMASDSYAQKHGRVPHLIDAPLSGGVEAAAAGSLSIMVGGRVSDFERARKIFDVCGDAVHLGPLGSGQIAKACNQIIVAANIIALGEVAAIASKAKIDLTALLQVLAKGYASSKILEVRGENVINED